MTYGEICAIMYSQNQKTNETTEEVFKMLKKTITKAIAVATMAVTLMSGVAPTMTVQAGGGICTQNPDGTWSITYPDHPKADLVQAYQLTKKQKQKAKKIILSYNGKHLDEYDGNGNYAFPTTSGCLKSKLLKEFDDKLHLNIQTRGGGFRWNKLTTGADVNYDNDTTMTGIVVENYGDSIDVLTIADGEMGGGDSGNVIIKNFSKDEFIPHTNHQ